ncbi:MAG: hypothetical protein COU07_03595 [Candidatus Harrisonbacteria bacterium CG10_big_fil_rev_8_21_14_0_10_40_38]|uniref:Uncharacterized protein n=1 Tax=Candidatus Harrisonbacteria bacterium CG10_big_fil_rev_8_21_14_0_10_40_38 TaxID=1974583 RepID=A0A2H0URD5_9BACT|nr:MAG: hypothetical protein COU07_03595 [Candidatus Harrisonbacteria bacterium CG10_big_fil_rev_8_21_14_0_10_40_38]
MREKFLTISSRFIISVFAFLISGVLAVYAFSEPTNTDYNQSIPSTLNNGSVTQHKLGNLILNSQNWFGEGLIVYDFNNPQDAKFGIGTENPSERLQVLGDVFVSGVINVLNSGGLDYGQDNQFLLRVRNNQMDWDFSSAWLSIPQIMTVDTNGNCTVAIADCPTDWTVPDSRIWNEYASSVVYLNNCPLTPGVYIGRQAKLCYRAY